MNPSSDNNIPTMSNPDDSNPNLVPPPKEPDDVMSQRKSSRSQNSAMKNKARQARGAAKTVSFKKNNGKLGKKGSKSVDGMDGVEFGEGSGVAEDEFDGDVASSVDAYSVDSRSFGDSVSEREFNDDIGEGMVNNNSNMIASSFVPNARGHVNQSVDCESSEYNMGNSDCDKLGNVSKSASYNADQNASVNPGSSPRILKRGEVLSDGGSKVDVAFSFNKVEKWPSLGSDAKVTSNVGNNGNMDVDNGGEKNDVRMADNSATDSNRSFAKALQGKNGGLNNKLKLYPISVNEYGKKFVDLDPVVEEGSKKWGMTLVGYFVGMRMPHWEISGHLRRMWRSYHFDEVILNGNGLYFLKFKSEEGMRYVLENGPWLVDGMPLFVQKWEAGSCMDKPEPTKVPIWVKIMNVPLEAWNSEGISRIASSIGNPIIMDRITTEMCENGYGRAGFARVLVEIEASSGLVDNVAVCYKSLGKSMELKVEYLWKPPICAHCKVFGHAFEKCYKRPISDTEKVSRDEVASSKQVNDIKPNSSGNEWQSVNYRRFTRNDGVSNSHGEQRFYVGESSNSRGGYNGRGRGGMQGRGSGSQRFNRYVQNQYAPVKKPSEVKKDSGKVSNLSNNGKGKMSGDDNVMGNEAIAKSGNKYASLADDAEMEKNLEWEAMKDRIDEVCSKGLVIGMEEKRNWPSDLLEYYKKKMEKYVNKGNVEVLRAKIKNFEKSIKNCRDSIVIAAKRKTDSIDKSGLLAQGLTEAQAYTKAYDEVYKEIWDDINKMMADKQLTEVEFFFTTGEVFTIYEWETWTAEMKDFYKSKIGEKAYLKLEEQIKTEFTYNVDEVAEDQPGAAQFLAQEILSNVDNGQVSHLQDVSAPHIVV